MIDRRTLLSLPLSLAAIPGVQAQTSGSAVIGYLSGRSVEAEQDLVRAMRQGLKETGYVEGRNLTIEYRWAKGEYDLVPGFADELVKQQVQVIVATGGPTTARAADAAKGSIPIVFASGSDPVADGLVASMNRPGRNITGIYVVTSSLGPKRLELLRELISAPTKIAYLMNPGSHSYKIQVDGVTAAAKEMGQAIAVLDAATAIDIEQAFSRLGDLGAGAVLMGADLFFQVQRDQLIGLAARHRVPVMYEWRDFVVAGGLASYSTVRGSIFTQLGIQVGRILNGAKPSDLAVQQATHFEFVLNLKTAKALGQTIPPLLLAQADEIIE